MKIVVCVKQVPDTKGGVKFKPDGTLDRAAMLTIMNPDDKAGLEAALRLKDQYGAEVTVVTMGLPKAEEVLREAMVMGAEDTGVDADNLRLCDEMVAIPQVGNIGSLNVSVAAGVMMYEVVRQRFSGDSVF